ncbi:MAG: EamA family transporter RarD, partial [Sphingomonadaceae bacterium]
TLLLAPVALGYLGWLASQSEMAFGGDLQTSLLLAASGVATAVPLLLFAAAARRMSYATIGLLQYIAPSIGFLLAVFAYDEPLTAAHLICFGFIWTGLVIYAGAGLIEGRSKRAAA